MSTPAWLCAARVRQAAQYACDDIYDPVTPQIFEQVFRIGESVFGTVAAGGIFWIVAQGTELKKMNPASGRLEPSIAGWEADFDALPFDHPVLGKLHGGFNRNLDAFVAQVSPRIPSGMPVIVTGHSKGAGEGAILAAKLRLAGFNVAAAILFACPNPGCRRLAQWYQDNRLDAVSYRNAPPGALAAFGDPVPFIPPFPYCPAIPHTLICAAPGGLEDLAAIDWHMGNLYIAAAKAMPPGINT